MFRLAFIGCGSIVGASHLPAAVRCRDVVVTHLVDRDTARAEELSRRFSLEAEVLSDYREIGAGVDGVLIALPNHLHHPASSYFLQRRVPVLCEKPLAPRLREAEQLVELSERLEVPLAVGYVYRFSPSTRVVKSALELGLLGDLLGCDLEWGDPGGWKTHSGYEIFSEQTGGGALIVNGIHFLDQMLYWFGPAKEIDYRDDSLGGPEANVEARLAFEWKDRRFQSNIRLSKTLRLRNRLLIQGSKATLKMPCSLTASVYLQSSEFRGLSVTLDPAEDEVSNTALDIFRAQLDDFIRAIRGGGRLRASGSESLPSLALVESCYRDGGKLNQPWEVPVGERVRATLSASPLRKVLVTGATGFIGGAICEQLSAEECIKVRALVHTAANAARIRRLPLEIVQGDLISRDEAMSAVEGCEAVIHLAAGSTRAIVEGTRNLLEASVRNSVQRFVLVSSVRVHGTNPGAETETEAAPTRKTGDPYGDAKLQQERLALRSHGRHGLPVVILRAPYVYGPYDHFSRGLVTKLKEGRWVSIDGGQGVLNAVFVYNLSEAIYLALSTERGVGEPMFITDDCPIEWSQCLAEYQHMFGGSTTPIAEVSRAEAESSLGAKRRSRAGSLVASAGKYVSSDAWNRMVAKIPLPASLRRRAMHLFGELLPQLREILREDKRFREIWLGNGVSPHPAVIDLEDDQMLSQLRQVEHSCGRAKEILGYRPRFDRQEALRLTEQWLRRAELLGSDET